MGFYAVFTQAGALAAGPQIVQPQAQRQFRILRAGRREKAKIGHIQRVDRRRQIEAAERHLSVLGGDRM